MERNRRWPIILPALLERFRYWGLHGAFSFTRQEGPSSYPHLGLDAFYHLLSSLSPALGDHLLRPLPLPISSPSVSPRNSISVLLPTPLTPRKWILQPPAPFSLVEIRPIRSPDISATHFGRKGTKKRQSLVLSYTTTSPGHTGYFAELRIAWIWETRVVLADSQERLSKLGGFNYALKKAFYLLAKVDLTTGSEPVK